MDKKNIAPAAENKLGHNERQALEQEIAQRENRLAEARREQREARRDVTAGDTVEPHRNWHAYALGGDLADCGLQGGDAYALMGLRSLPIPRLVRLLLDAHDERPGIYLGRLLPGIIDTHRDELHARGLALSWQRRWIRYQEQLAAWQAQPDAVKAGVWRDKPITMGQRELVRITATLLDLAMPVGLDRGGAADWLETQGANLNYTIEG
ncbi:MULTISPECIES: hypothetical protein [Sphingomonadaceae]|nr:MULTISPECIES: hypothetical protein [Sphingomonadaceae]NBB40101.1 hypothetical protein [Sphingobium yanoikuyae]